jgi:hypothetical protein
MAKPPIARQNDVIFLPQAPKISPNQPVNPAGEAASTKGVFDFGRAVV